MKCPLIQRYDPDVTMTKSQDGDYVKYEDYEKLVKALAIEQGLKEEEKGQ